MGTTEAIVAVIVGLFGGGTMRSIFLYLKDRKREQRRVELGTEELEVTETMVRSLQTQITAMSAAFDQERAAWQGRDQVRRERIAELESELGDARDQLAEAKQMLARVTEQVESLTVKLSSLSDGHLAED